MIRRPPRSTQSRSSAASDVYQRDGRRRAAPGPGRGGGHGPPRGGRGRGRPPARRHARGLRERCAPRPAPRAPRRTGPMTVDVRPAGLPTAGPGLRIAFHPASATIVAHVLHVRRVHSLEREAFVAALGGVDLGPGAILVHTCHRVELYLAAGSTDLPALPPLPAGAERLEDVDAVRHLIEVACG